MSDPREFGIRDMMALGVNEMYCTCGERLWPDCDVSSVSITEEFERHLIDSHGFTREQITEALARPQRTEDRQDLVPPPGMGDA